MNAMLQTEAMDQAAKLAAQDMQLIINGYEPVAVEGKRSLGNKWSTRKNTVESINAERAALPNATNTGLRTGTLVGVDVDIRNPDHAERVKFLAFEFLGTTPLVRTGAKGAMLLYRNPAPISKITVASLDSKVEILGTGQQFVGLGIHPDTGKLYTWGQDDVGALDPLTVPFADLPAVSPDQLRAFTHRAKQLLIELRYGQVKVTGDLGEKQVVRAPPPLAGEPMTIDQLRGMLAFLDPDAPRDEWRDNVAAIRAAPIPDDQDESHRRQAALDYSCGKLDRLGRFKDALPLLYTGDEAVDQVLDTMPPKVGGIGIGTIINRARAAGYRGPISLAEARSSQEVFGAALTKLPPTHTKTGRPSRFSTRAEDKLLPAPLMLIEDLIPDDADVMIVGPSKTLKTFLGLALAVATATGRPAFGKYNVFRQGSAFYCAGEGALSVRKKRVTACEMALGLPPYSAERVHIASSVPSPDDGSESEFIADAQDLMKPGERAGIFIFDTLNRALNGADEDSSATASRYLNMLARIRGELGGSTITLHHTGKDTDRGARGSSAFYAGFDTVIIIDSATKGEQTGEWSLAAHVDKQKDGTDELKFYLRAHIVTTPDGPSLALETASEDDIKRAAGKPVGLRRQDIGAALQTRGACLGGANEWNGKNGGIDTRGLAVAIAQARAKEAGIGKDPIEKEIDVIVMALNRGARNGAFSAYVVREKNPRQWAIAPGVVDEAQDV